MIRLPKIQFSPLLVLSPTSR